MNYGLYLLYVPNSGWGVFDKANCPDPKAFSDWMYREYQISEEEFNSIFDKLKEVQQDLISNKVIPAENRKDVFPELSDLIEKQKPFSKPHINK